MAIYWLSSQIPELKDMHKEMREEIVEMALYSIAISRWNLFSFVALLFPLAAAGLALQGITGGVWVKYVYLLAGFPIFWVWWLNAAQPRIREIVNEVARRPKDGPSADGNQ
jgi:hypothetical protein